MLKKLILLMLILFLFFNLSWGEKITHTLTFSQKDLSFIKLKGYDIIYLKDGEITDRVGEPQLPLKIVSFSLPAFAKVEKVEVVSSQKEKLKGGPEPIPMIVGDVNCDGKIDLADAIYLANYLFKSGPPPCNH